MKTLDTICLVAHRGDQERATENSLAAFRQALEGGALWLECDVQFSSDGVPVLFHDPNLRRLCGVEGILCERTFEELPPLPNGESIPTLAALLALLLEYPSAMLLMEIKTEIFPYFPIPEVVAKLGEMLASNQQVVPISFSAEVLHYWWHNLRHQRLGWIGDKPEGAPDIPLAFLFMSHEAFLRQGRPTIGEQLGVYTVNDDNLARRLLQSGVDLIETDHFCRLRRLMTA